MKPFFIHIPYISIVKKYATYLIFGLWGAVSATLAPIMEEWGTSTYEKKAIMISCCVIFIAISLILVQKYKPENILNPGNAGPKTKDLFNRQPLLAGFINMVFVVAVATTLMVVIN